MNPETPPLQSDKAIEECIRVFNASEFARLLGMEISEARDGYSRVTMDCPGKMNPGGVAHGGAIFALADQAFGIAANCCGVHRVAVEEVSCTSHLQRAPWSPLPNGWRTTAPATRTA